MTENASLVAMIHGVDSTLGKAVAVELARREVRLVLAEPDPRLLAEISHLAPSEVTTVSLDGEERHQFEDGSSPEKALVQRAWDVFGKLDALVNLCVPGKSTTPQWLRQYPGSLLDRCLAASQLITTSTPRGSIVNHCFMPAMYAGTCLERELPMLKGAITGVTRILCRKFGSQGLRVNTVQTGFIDMPESKSLASADVLQLKPPIGRWGTPEEVAKFIAFLVTRNGYMTGQAVIMDGGLTAGITGT
jgi:NAD(P)-dependent dehydrogenase (short-subunit alcohol dehydrogenase family)